MYEGRGGGGDKCGDGSSVGGLDEGGNEGGDGDGDGGFYEDGNEGEMKECLGGQIIHHLFGEFEAMGKFLVVAILQMMQWWHWIF